MRNLRRCSGGGIPGWADGGRAGHAFVFLLSSLQLGRTTWTRTDAVKSRGRSLDWSRPGGRDKRNSTIFEGTTEIQRLVIARAISGSHIK
jgi:alkylation response protein AidB-like acyl-CoA dehydrogenase